jgi:hypothetical protein
MIIEWSAYPTVVGSPPAVEGLIWWPSVGSGASKSNWLRTNPWNIQITGATILWEGMIPMIQCAYVGYTDKTHAVEVYDENLHLVARLSGRTDLNSVRTGRISWVDGLRIPTLLENGGTNLPSGRLLIYFR